MNEQITVHDRLTFIVGLALGAIIAIIAMKVLQ